MTVGYVDPTLYGKEILASTSQLAGANECVGDVVAQLATGHGEGEGDVDGFFIADRKFVDVRDQVEAADTFNEANLGGIAFRAGGGGFDEQRDHQISVLLYSHAHVGKWLCFVRICAQDVEVLVQASALRVIYQLKSFSPPGQRIDCSALRINGNGDEVVLQGIGLNLGGIPTEGLSFFYEETLAKIRYVLLPE